MTVNRESAGATRSGTELFTAGWRFFKGDADAWSPGFDDASWRTLDLPHDWSIEGPFDESLTSATAYLPGGIGWYRRRFSLAEAGYAPGMRVRLRFDGVYNHSTVWCNGTELGTRPFGYSSFSYDLTEALDPARDEQVIAVRVDHSDYSDSRWYTGSGIYRNVWLTVAEPVHIAENGVFVQTPQVLPQSAQVRVETDVENRGTTAARVVLLSAVTDAAGREVAHASGFRTVPAGEAATFAQTMTVRGPELWSPERPALYRVRTVLATERPDALAAPAEAGTDEAVELINGIPVSTRPERRTDQGPRSSIDIDPETILDTRLTSFGIRSFSFDPDYGFSINGVPTKLRGVCVHHDAGCFGAAVPAPVWARRLRILKEAGCNAIRFSHNPPAPELLDLCDRLGFFTIDEAFDEWEETKNKWVSGHNQGTPSREGYGVHFADWHEADLRAMLLRDRNHPSIIMWSIGNEIDYPNDPWTHPVLGERFRADRPSSDRLGVVAGRLAAIVRSLDPTRPVTSALADVTISNRTGFADALDVVGYNYLERHYREDHIAYPQRVIYGSENGQSLEAWAAVRDNEYICGQFLWTGIDFLGEARGWPVRNSQAGYLDTAAFRKPLFYFRKSLWSQEPTLWLGALPPGTEEEPRPRRGWGEMPNWSWQGHEGESVVVVAHTNCDAVELLQDGVSRGLRRLAEVPDQLMRWEVPYAEGKLTARGYRDDELVATAELCSSGPAAGVAAAWGKEAGDERSFLRADGNDIIHVELTVVDATGVPVYDAELPLALAVEGPARIIGLENGDPASHEPYGTGQRRVHQGRLLAVLQSTGDAGAALVTVRGEGLHPSVITIPCV